MPSLRHLTYDIETGPGGPEVGAFFDLDGTLVAGFSAIAFLRDRLTSGDLTLQDLADVALAGLSFRREGLGFSGLMAASWATNAFSSDGFFLSAV